MDEIVPVVSDLTTVDQTPTIDSGRTMEVIEHVPPKHLIRDTLMWYSDTIQALRMFDRNERRFIYANAYLDKLEEEGGPIDNILLTARTPGLDGSSDVEVRKDVLENAYRQLWEVSADFDLADQAELYRIHPARAAHPILTKGGSAISSLFPTGDVEHWLNGALASVPTSFTTRLYQIRFMQHSNSGTHGAELAGRHFAGRFLSNQYELEVDTEELSADLDLSNEHDRSDFLDRIRGAVIHEAGHNAIQNVLPISDLRQFVSVTRREPVAVSSYVQQIRETKPLHVALQEDFCETLRLFVASPDRLRQVAPERFAYMSRLVERG